MHEKGRKRKKILESINYTKRIEEGKLKGPRKTKGQTYFDEEIQILKALNPQKYKHINIGNITKKKTLEKIFKEIYKDNADKIIQNRRVGENNQLKLKSRDLNKILEQLKDGE